MAQTFNKIQGYRCGDIGLGYKFTFDLDNNFLACSNHVIDDEDNDDIITTFENKNLIRFYELENENSSITV